MPDHCYAIVVTHTNERWRWVLIDPEARTVGEGAAETQEEAMESGWSLAAGMEESGRSVRRPEIFVGNTDANRDAAR